MQGFLFWGGLCGVLAGVVSSEFFSIGMWGAVWSCILAMLLHFLGRIISSPRAGAFFFIVLVSFAVGAVRAEVVSPVRTYTLDTHIGEQVTLVGSVISEPDERESSARISIQVESVSTKGTEDESARGVVLAIVPPNQEIEYGDMVSLSGTLVLPESFDTDTGRLFDYPGYLAVRGIGYMLSFAKVNQINEGGWSVYRLLFTLKSRYAEGLGAALVEPHAGLAAGITVGDKRALGGELLDVFRDAGVIHIIVLSGYNITIIVVAFLWLLQRRSRKERALIGMVAIALFVLMTGAGAASVRAGIMATLALLAMLSYRKYAVSRALAVSILCMVLWNPRILLHDVGFQLSVMATLGIIFVVPHITRRLGFISGRWGVREIVATTIGTQVAVLPLLIYYMGTISLVALFANVLVLPVVPLAMLFSFVAGVTGMFVGGIVSVVVGYPAYALLGYMLSVSTFAAAAPLATVHISEVSLWFVLGAYAIGVLLLARAQSAMALGEEKETGST